MDVKLEYPTIRFRSLPEETNRIKTFLAFPCQNRDGLRDTIHTLRHQQ